MTSRRRTMGPALGPVYALAVTLADGVKVVRGPWPELSTARAMRTRYLKTGNVEYPYKRTPARAAQILRAAEWEEIE